MRLYLGASFLFSLFLSASPALAQQLLGSWHGTEGMFGYAVAHAGDVDSDGYGDFVASAPWKYTDGGEVQIISGKDGTVLYTHAGAAAGDRLGEAVSGAGDVNGDGLADWIVSAVNPMPTADKAGVVRVYSGKDGALLHQWTGSAAPSQDNFGVSVAGAGDVDGDGKADLLVGASEFGLAKNGKGYARVYSGASGSELFTVRGILGFDLLGGAVGAAGDLDHDGFADVLIGAPSITIGYAVVVSGKKALDFVAGKPSKSFALDTPGLLGSGVVPANFASGVMGDRFGSSVALLGDVSADGHPDYAVGAPKDATQDNFAGKVMVFSGAGGTLLYERLADGAQDQLGWALAGLGDVDGDGVGDLAAGAKEHGDEGVLFGLGLPHGNGYVRIYSGADGSTIATLAGPSFGAEMGRSLGGGGDLDADGYPDLLVGVPGFGDMMEGSVFAYSFSPFQPIGWGCAGSGGAAPKLLLSGSPVPGGKLTAGIAGGLGGSAGLILFGIDPLELSLGGGCALFVVPAAEPIVLSLDGIGSGSFSGILPASLPSGLELRMQGFVVDPGTAQGFSSTAGCLVEVQ